MKTFLEYYIYNTKSKTHGNNLYKLLSNSSSLYNTKRGVLHIMVITCISYNQIGFLKLLFQLLHLLPFHANSSFLCELSGSMFQLIDLLLKDAQHFFNILCSITI